MCCLCSLLYIFSVWTCTEPWSSVKNRYLTSVTTLPGLLSLPWSSFSKFTVSRKKTLGPNWWLNDKIQLWKCWVHIAYGKQKKERICTCGTRNSYVVVSVLLLFFAVATSVSLLVLGNYWTQLKQISSQEVWAETGCSWEITTGESVRWGQTSSSWTISLDCGLFKCLPSPSTLCPASR